MCGPRLIINSGTPNYKKKVLPKTEQQNLPLFCEPTKDLYEDFIYQDLDIFTEFGDLSPAQALHIFNQFVRFPEFKDCPFQSTMETSFEKTTEESIENVSPDPDFDILDDPPKELDDV